MDIVLLISAFFLILFFAHGILNPKKETGKKFDEVPRQVAHALTGLCAIGIAYFFGIESAKIVILAGLVFGLTLSTIKMTKKKILFVDSALFYFERPGCPPGYGAIAYFCGILFCLSAFPSEVALYLIYIMAVCDAAATVFGKEHGLFKLPYNKKKSFEGLLAFLAFAMPVVAIGGNAVVPMVLAAAILETVDLGIDDNVLVPLSGFAYGII